MKARQFEEAVRRGATPRVVAARFWLPTHDKARWTLVIEGQVLLSTVGRPRAFRSLTAVFSYLDRVKLASFTVQREPAPIDDRDLGRLGAPGRTESLF